MTESLTYRRLPIVVLLCVCTVLAPRASAQQDGAGDKPVTREEFRRFLEEYKQLKADVAKLQEQNSQLRQQVTGLQGENAVRHPVSKHARHAHNLEVRDQPVCSSRTTALRQSGLPGS